MNQPIRKYYLYSTATGYIVIRADKKESLLKKSKISTTTPNLIIIAAKMGFINKVKLMKSIIRN
jgi:hypothetical protein